MPSIKGEPVTGKAIAVLSGIKGLFMAVILTTVLTPTFWQTLIVAVSSASVSGMFLLISTHLNSRKTDSKVEEVKRETRETKQHVAHVTEVIEGGEDA